MHFLLAGLTPWQDNVNQEGAIHVTAANKSPTGPRARGGW